MLRSSARKLFLLAAGAQVSLGLLDLLGIALIGLVAAVAVSGIGVTQVPTFLQDALSWLGLEDLTVSQLSVALALMAVLMLVTKTALSAFLFRRITLFLAARQVELAVSLSRKFLQRPLADVQRWTSSEAIYALGTGTTAATVSLLSSAIIIAAEIFLFTIVGIGLLLFDPLLTLAAIALFAALIFILHRLIGRLVERNANTLKESSIDSLTAVADALATYRETMVLNRRGLYAKRYQDIVTAAARANASNTYIAEVPKFVLEIALYLGVLVLAVVQFLTKDWASAASTVALFLAAGSRVIPALLRLQGAGITIRNSSVMAQPTFFMYDFLNQPAASPDRSHPTAREISEHITHGYGDFNAEVAIDEISFTYEPGRPPALQEVSLHVPPGRSAALVGPTGAGKSTLTDVILGVIEPQTGKADISGLAPSEAIHRWPGAITYVPQAVALIEGSVRENVALGLPRELVDDALVWEALERAHIDTFLKDHREGLDTPIGERGFKLSGGQRQRLGIARALYTRPKLLILDEATSALDAETERAIVSTLQELEGQVTTITVAHRLATIRHVDQVLYLDHGQVLARGTFEDVRLRIHDFDRQAQLLGL